MSFVILTLLLIQVAAPSKGPDDVADLPPALTHLDKRTHELVIELPRIDVPARGEMGEGMVRSPVYRVDVPINCSIYRYRVTVVYDNPTGALLPDGGMGAVAGGFVPDRRGAWPRVDTTDAAYRQDLTDILLHMGSGAAHHHH